MSRHNIETAFPLTPLQEGMLYHTIRYPESSVYHGQCTATLSGPMQEDLFRQAWNLAAKRHQAFRTFFAWERREQPLQVVRERVELAWDVLDWSVEAAEDQEVRWKELLESDQGQAFDLSRAPVMRFVLVHLGEERHELLWSLHHALADGWSGMLVLKEVIEDYNSLCRGSEPERPTPPSFAKFVTWLNSRDSRAAEAFWRGQLAGFDEPTPIPGARNRRHGTTRTTTEIALDEHATPQLQSAGARMRVTPSTIVVAAWALVLSRYVSFADEVVFGVTISERPPEISGVDRSVGLYLSTVPVRVGVPKERSVADWLGDLQTTLSDGRDHSAGGLADIQSWSELEHTPDLARSLVVYESFPPGVVEPRDDGQLRIDSTTISAPSDLPLALLVYPDEHLTLQLVYDPSLYDEGAAERLLDEVTRTLMALTEAAERRVEDIDVLGPRTRHTLLDSWSGADIPRPVERDVLELFEEQAARSPQAIAVRTVDSEISYGDLDRAANRLAHRIVSEGLDGDSLLGIPAVRSIETVAAVLACLKAGHGHTLVDPNQPDARLTVIVGHVARVLTGSNDTGRWNRRLSIDLSAAGPATKPDRTPSSGSVAYVTWTSGSTGTPKGVTVERGHLARSTAARLAYYSEPPERFLLLSSLAVDSAVAGFYWTLCTGGCLILPPFRMEQDLDGLTLLIDQARVTTTLLVPSLYRALLEDGDAERLRSLRSVVVAGEPLPESLVTLHYQRLPASRLFNEYGPSEATVWATVAESSDRDRAVTIGRPVPFVQVYLLDPSGHPVPLGAPGEICLGGETVARGYLDEPKLTAERFVDDPFREGDRMYRTGDLARFLSDGRIEFLGRLDDQIKIRGFRVEPGEIERTLERHPGIVESAVVAEEAMGSREAEALVAELMKRAGPDAERLLTDVLEAR